MKRHLLGFALFNLIVGTALVVAILTGNFPRPATRYVYEVSKTSCPMNVRQNRETPKIYESKSDSIKVTQAVLNEKTRKLDLSFLIQRETPSTQDVKIKLVFWRMMSKGNGVNQGSIYTENVNLSLNPDGDNSGTLSTTASYKWLDELKDSDSLNVRAEIVNDVQNNSEYDSSKSVMSEFTPILLMKNK